MKNVKKIGKNKLYILLISSMLCLVFAGFITNISHFPENIYIAEGTEGDFRLNFPLNTEIAPVSLQTSLINGLNADYSNDSIIADTAGTSEQSAEVTLTALGLPIKKVSLNVVNEIEIIPGGVTVGVKISTEGVLVLGTGYVTGEDGQAYRPSEGLLKAGDILLSANGRTLGNKEELVDIINENTSVINFVVKRGDEKLEVTITPIKTSGDDINKIGLWVRDSTQGIGTITYYNPESNKYGALGHGIMDVDTKQIMVIKEGIVMETNIKSIKKGKKGSPGELVGDINKNNIIGTVKLNNEFGLYGNLNVDSNYFTSEPMRIGLQGEVHEGPATIKTNIEGHEVKEYDIYIESVNKFSSDDSKGMVIRITDTELLAKSNGIVQGMSGSPIIQDGKIIGAVTHVFVQDPAKGYGIFIENMLKQEKLYSQAD